MPIHKNLVPVERTIRDKDFRTEAYHPGFQFDDRNELWENHLDPDGEFVLTIDDLNYERGRPGVGHVFGHLEDLEGVVRWRQVVDARRTVIPLFDFQYPDPTTAAPRGPYFGSKFEREASQPLDKVQPLDEMHALNDSQFLDNPASDEDEADSDETEVDDIPSSDSTGSCIHVAWRPTIAEQRAALNIAKQPDAESSALSSPPGSPLGKATLEKQPSAPPVVSTTPTSTRQQSSRDRHLQPSNKQSSQKRLTEQSKPIMQKDGSTKTTDSTRLLNSGRGRRGKRGRPVRSG